MVNVVETYFQLSRKMSSEQYYELLRNAVYNKDKATELKDTLDTLGFNWMTLKEQIKTLKLA